MLPPKIGEGVFGSSSGGVKPTGASFVTASAVSSAAAALIVLENLRGLGEEKEKVGDCFHGTETRSVGLRAEKEGLKREAWVAMAMLGRVGLLCCERSVKKKRKEIKQV